MPDIFSQSISLAGVPQTAFSIATFQKKTVGRSMIGRRLFDQVREMSGVFNLAGLCALATKVAR
jgi:hypothetical protein